MAAPHDLLELRTVDELIADGRRPLWATEALARAPYVVVRRARAAHGAIAVGIRGPARRQRLAALLRPAAVSKRVAPEDLVVARAWRRTGRRASVPALAALERIAVVLDDIGRPWGPAGSVGFELATGVPVTRPQSDLDLVVRCRLPWAPSDAREVLATLDGLAGDVPVDVQIETPAGAVALREYAAGRAPLLLRTVDGPALVDDPWAAVVAT